MRLPATCLLLTFAACTRTAPEPSTPPAAPLEKPQAAAAPAPALTRERGENELGKLDAAQGGVADALAGTSGAGAATAGPSSSVSALVGGGGLSAKGAGLGGGGRGIGSLGESYGLGGLGTRGRGGSGVIGQLGSGSGIGSLQPDSTGGGEDYGSTTINAWTLTEKDHLSTFAVDVDTASYTLARRKLLEHQLPPAASVRVEEWLNYFRYRYPQPEQGQALSVSMDAAPSPFSPGKHLLRVGVQGKTLDLSERKQAHLTFLVDVSGSMQGPDRLPLAKRALRMLVDQLHDGDTVALVTYAGNVRLVLPPTGLERKAEIHAAIEDLTAGGSTAMSSGIDLAYQQAVRQLDSQSISRVIVLSDGDANVGPASHQQILEQIRGHVKEGVTLTTVGFGVGNYKAALMEQLADKGNGNSYYVDSLMAARRIFVEQLGGTLQVIAQDVKLQVDFDPAQVNAYRLVGYENRDIADRDFRNDKVDAGEIGAGHTVTALYEVDLKQGAGDALVTVRLRAKQPRGTTASEKAFVFGQSHLAARFEDAPADLRFATSVMGAAEIFRRSPHAAEWSYDQVLRIAREATPPGNAERQEFLSLLERAKSVATQVARR